MNATPDNLRLHMGLSEGSKPRAMKSRPVSTSVDRHGFFLVLLLSLHYFVMYAFKTFPVRSSMTW